VDAIADIEDTNIGDSLSYGLNIQGNILCDSFVTLCSMDYTRDYGLYIARGIQLLMRKNALSFIVNSPKLSADKTLNMEYHLNKIGWLNDQLTHVMDWLVQEYSEGYSGCYMCDNGPQYQVNEIIV
jgi:hypothetical protein